MKRGGAKPGDETMLDALDIARETRLSIETPIEEASIALLLRLKRAETVARA